MKKLLLIILFYTISNNFLLVLAQDNKVIVNSDYKKEEFNWCPSMEEAGYWREKYIDKYGCIGASIDLYSKQQREIALDFAKRYKKA